MCVSQNTCFHEYTSPISSINSKRYCSIAHEGNAPFNRGIYFIGHYAKNPFLHPDQQHQLKNNLPAYIVGSLRAHVQVECLVEVINDLVSSDNPQEKLKHFTQALHEVFAFGRSKKHMIQRQLGRLEPTPSLKYRAHEVMRTTPVMST
jgi:hypothetical protein